MNFNRSFEPDYGKAVELTAGIRRITANNPGPFTFYGTNTYLIGAKSVVVIDPGPDNAAHLNDVLRAIGDSTLEAILVSHTHVDHSPGARKLKAATGAPIIGCDRHRPARMLLPGEINPLDASSDADYRADKVLRDGEAYSGREVTLTAVETPGHTDNHVCFALSGTPTLFSADHVMAWSTSIVAPPDGSMRAYMASLETLLKRPESTYFPGHGGPVQDAPAFVDALKTHRLQREAAIRDRLGPSPVSIKDLVEQIYADVPKNLHGAAALSVYAHLEDLTERGLAVADPELGLNAKYRALN